MDYHNTEYVLYLYYDVWHHLKEQTASNSKLITKEELFNLHHSSLSNVVEHIFEIMKNWFKIFKRSLEYSLQTQIDLVFAFTAFLIFIIANAICTNIYDEKTPITKSQIQT